MDWLTTIWTAFISASLALSGVYLLSWVRRRELFYLLFVLLGVTVAIQAATEVWMFRTSTIEEYGTALRWFHVPAFFAVCMTVALVHFSFGADRIWLGLLACGLRLVSLVVNFVQDPNLNYVQLVSVEKIQFLGESIAIGKGVSSPWMLTGQVSLLILLIYLLDVAYNTWRRDGNRRTVLFCIAMAALVLIAGVQGVLAFWDLVEIPMLATPFFIGVAAVMATEVGLQMRRAEQLNEALQANKAQLEQASQVAAMGELSGALAHEINQPLGVILSNAEAASLMLDSDQPNLDELRDIVGDIISADRRAANVIVRLRRLLKRGDPALKESDLNAAVNEAIGYLAKDLRANGILLRVTLDPELPPVWVDRILMVQVMMNLLNNARDAVKDKPDGERNVAIETSLDKDAVVVSVTDSGRKGLPDDIDQLFNPFVTTKEKGLGMGLAIVKSVIEAHNGQIHAKHRPESGTLFQFSIPRK